MSEAEPNLQTTDFEDKAIADPIYDFEHLGGRIAESLVLAAKAQVDEAQSLLDQTKALADSIRAQVSVQTEALAAFNARLKTFGGELLEAHKKFNGGSHAIDQGSARRHD